MTNATNDWSKSSWLNYPALQQPNWPDLDEHRAVLTSISQLPPLVFAGEARSLKAGAPIYEQDELETGIKSFAVVAFNDDSRVTMSPETVFRIGYAISR